MNWIWSKSLKLYQRWLKWIAGDQSEDESSPCYVAFQDCILIFFLLHFYCILLFFWGCYYWTGAMQSPHSPTISSRLNVTSHLVSPVATLHIMYNSNSVKFHHQRRKPQIQEENVTVIIIASVALIVIIILHIMIMMTISLGGTGVASGPSVNKFYQVSLCPLSASQPLTFSSSY